MIKYTAHEITQAMADMSDKFCCDRCGFHQISEDDAHVLEEYFGGLAVKCLVMLKYVHVRR